LYSLVAFLMARFALRFAIQPMWVRVVEDKEGLNFIYELKARNESSDITEHSSMPNIFNADEFC
jgi:hypothetical protein